MAQRCNWKDATSPSFGDCRGLQHLPALGVHVAPSSDPSQGPTPGAEPVSPGTARSLLQCMAVVFMPGPQLSPLTTQSKAQCSPSLHASTMAFPLARSLSQLYKGDDTDAARAP